MFDNRVKEYTVETGEVFPLDILAPILSQPVDPDTADRIDDAKHDHKDFKNVEDWVKKRDVRLRAHKCQAPPSVKGPIDMVYDVFPPAHDEPRPSPAQAAGLCAAYWSSASDTWQGSSADPGANSGGLP